MSSKDEYKHFIELSLKIYKDEQISLEEAVKGIIEMHHKKFSWDSFFKGLYAGIFLYILILEFVL